MSQEMPILTPWSFAVAVGTLHSTGVSHREECHLPYESILYFTNKQALWIERVVATRWCPFWSATFRAYPPTMQVTKEWFPFVDRCNLCWLRLLGRCGPLWSALESPALRRMQIAFGECHYCPCHRGIWLSEQCGISSIFQLEDSHMLAHCFLI
jgi:hypothetical protein